MSPYIVMLAYGCAAALAILLLYAYESRAWYWHAVSLALAFVIGYVPTPQGFDNPAIVAITGFAIIFLLFWGLGGLLLLLAPQHHKHA